MKRSGFRGFLLLTVCGLAAAAGHAENRNPCEIITKAEAVVGGKLEGRQLSPKGTLSIDTFLGAGALRFPAEA